MWENDSCGKVIYLVDVQGPEKVNDTCEKTMHAGTLDSGITVIHSLLIILKPKAEENFLWAPCSHFNFHSRITFTKNCIFFEDVLPYITLRFYPNCC
jgi:hypothetical protein